MKLNCVEVEYMETECTVEGGYQEVQYVLRAGKGRGDGSIV